jgi:hypothetical protein
MVRGLLLVLAVLVGIAGAAQAQSPLLTLTAAGPTPAPEQHGSGQIMGYDSLTFLTVVIGGAFGAAVGTEIAVIGLGVAGYTGPTLAIAGASSFVAGAAAGAFTGNYLLQLLRSQPVTPLEGPAANARALRTAR